MKFADTLLGFFLEGLGAGREVSVLVAKEFIGDLAGQQDTDRGVLVDVLATEVHADGSTNGRNVVGAKGFDDGF